MKSSHLTRTGSRVRAQQWELTQTAKGWKSASQLLSPNANRFMHPTRGARLGPAAHLAGRHSTAARGSRRGRGCGGRRRRGRAAARTPAAGR